jgi:hypothetical protein
LFAAQAVTVEKVVAALELGEKMGIKEEEKLMKDARQVLVQVKHRDELAELVNGDDVKAIQAAIVRAKELKLDQALMIQPAEDRIAALGARAALTAAMEVKEIPERDKALSAAIKAAEALGSAHGFGKKDPQMIEARNLIKQTTAREKLKACPTSYDVGMLQEAVDLATECKLVCSHVSVVGPRLPALACAVAQPSCLVSMHAQPPTEFEAAKNRLEMLKESKERVQMRCVAG